MAIANTAAAVDTTSEEYYFAQLWSLADHQLRGIINLAVTDYNLPAQWRPAHWLTDEELVESIHLICEEAPAVVGQRFTLGEDLNIIPA